MLLTRFASASALVALVGAPALADDTLTSVEDKTPHQPTGTFTIGAGYGPDDGFIARAAIEQPDLFRTGQRLALSADISQLRQRALLEYDIPLLPNLDLETGLFTSRRDFTSFTREGAGGELGLAYKIDKHTKIYGRYRFEAVTTVDVVNQKPLPVVDAHGLGNGNIATLGAGFVHDTLDDRFIPRRGTRFEAFVDRAEKRWGSEYEFERMGGSVDVARPLGALTLRLHGHATLIRGDVPLSERLQHDGHAEVRGYALDSLPPLGSNLEAVGRVELETPSWKGLSIAGWADVGWRKNTDAMYGGDTPLLQRSVGASLIWRSPIGPLRVDWAMPLDGDKQNQVLFGLGGWWW